MKAKITFDFYHDGINPTRYESGDEVPEGVAVPAEWLEQEAPAEQESTASESGDEVPAKKGRK